MPDIEAHLAPVADSPAARFFGWGVDTADRRNLSIRFDPAASCRGEDGLISPSFASAMMELAFRGLVLAATGGRMAARPVDLHVQFVDEDLLRGVVVASVLIVRQGATVAFMEGDLKTDDGALILRATCRSKLKPANALAEEHA